MKKTTLIVTAIAIIIAGLTLLLACGGSKSGDNESATESGETTEPMPLNISVYLDLSDRLTRDLTPSQMDRDTAIINHIVDLFVKHCIDSGKIINSTNHFQVFFYPAPNNSQIAQLARGLNVDLAKTELKQKKVELMEMKSRFQNNLTQIYSDAISDHQWVGSDIWGFFSNGEVDKLCMRKGYRNILVILTDGYLYHTGNKIKEGTAYSYALPQTLAIANSSLIVRREGLQDLEVLMLEVNPYDAQQRNKLIPVLEDWFRNMEVGKFVVSETALPVTTEVYIDSFLQD